MSSDPMVKAIYEEAKAEMLRMVVHYGATKEHIETRHWEKLDRILDIPEANLARTQAKAAVDSLFTTMLSLWSNNKIPGPQTPENLEKKAKQAESLAKMQYEKGNDQAAEKQKQRAADLKATAQKLRAHEPEPKKRKRRAS